MVVLGAACTPALASADGVTYKKEIDVTDKYGTYYTAKCEAKKILNGDPMSLCTYDEKEKKVKWSAKKKPTCQGRRMLFSNCSSDGLIVSHS